jgi:uncharacterized membrane protein YqjE
MQPDRTTARERNQAAVADHASRMLGDTRFAALRTRRARIRLVAAETALVVATPVAWIAAGAIAGLLVVMAAIGVQWALRRSIRVVADLPDEVLDERQRALRNAMYVEAYRYLAGIVVVMMSAGLVAFIVQADETDTWNVDLTWNWVMAAFWTVQLLALGLPSMAVAIGEGGEPVFDPED